MLAVGCGMMAEMVPNCLTPFWTEKMLAASGKVFTFAASNIGTTQMTDAAK